MHSVLVGSVCLLLSPFLAWGQANVNESLETAFIYVDAANGSDGNPGTAGQPLQTIGAAVTMAETNNKNNVGSRVIINPGVYRESVTVAPPVKSTSMPITIEAAVDGTVYVSGAQTFTGWKVYGGNSSIYTNSWPYAWGLCTTLGPGAPLAPDIVLRREMVFVNGVPLTEVLSLSEVAWPGTFYVDEVGGTIYAWPPAGVNMSTADTEVSVLPSVLTVKGQSNIVVRGITFEYASSCRENAAVTVWSFNQASNVLLDTDSFLWNNAQGLSISSNLSDFTVQNSVSNHNGEAGFQATKVKNGLFQSNQASYNNWRGAQGAYYVWNAGGGHFYQMHNLAVNELALTYNETYGVHFDTDNANITANSVNSFANVVAQMFVELSEGPTSIAGSTLCAGSPTTSYSNAVGLKVRNSEFLTLTSSNLVNTYQAMWVMGSATPLSVTNWESGEVYNLLTQNMTLSQDVLETGTGKYVFSDGIEGSAWSTFQTTLSSNYNTWWNASNTTDFIVPVPKLGTYDSLTGWQSATGQDTQSTWSAPAGTPTAACSQYPDVIDFWLVIPYNASPVSVNPGSSARLTATLVPVLFNGIVQLSYDGVQSISGATASWSSNSVSANGTATFTLNTSATTPAGTYPVVLIANQGSLTRTLTVLFTVN